MRRDEFQWPYDDTLGRPGYTQLFRECYRVLRPDRYAHLLLSSQALLELGPLFAAIFPVKNLIVWDKVNPGFRHYFRHRHESILFACNGLRGQNWGILARCIPYVPRLGSSPSGT